MRRREEEVDPKELPWYHPDLLLKSGRPMLLAKLAYQGAYRRAWEQGYGAIDSMDYGQEAVARLARDIKRTREGT